jgi:hypothetical protein
MDGIEDPDRFLNQAGTLAVKIYAEEMLGHGRPLTVSTDEGNTYNVDEATEVAEHELQKPPAKHAICAALKSGSDDLMEFTKTIGAALLPLVLTGLITLPLVPIAFAAAALTVYRVGVAMYCADAHKE